MEAKGDGSMHIMISYNWDHQREVVKIKNELENLGYKIWIDLNNLKGNINRAMAEGVEGACAILMCVTDAYKASYNCEKEAGYADSLRKPIIPLKLQQGVKFDGWIGPVIGSKLYFDFSDSSKLQQTIKSLDAELASTGMKEKARNPDARPPFMSLDVDGISKWLKELSVDDSSISCFKSNCVTGKDLAVLTKEELMSEDFKIKPFVATKILRNRDEAMGILPPNITARCSTPSEMGESMAKDNKKSMTRKDKLAATTTATSTGPPVRYKRGDRVEVFWSSSWFPSEVIEVGPRRLLKIHYESYDDSHDEKVDYQECTWRNGSKIEDLGQIQIGSELKYNSYDVTVVDIFVASCKIRYDGYSSSWDTWVLPDEVKLVKSAQTAPSPSQDQTSSTKSTKSSHNIYKVGDKVKISWANTWYSGYILEEGPHISFKIHYEGWESSYDESVDVSMCKWRHGKLVEDAKKVKKGDKLTVLWGGTWYDAVVIEITSAVCKVRYDNYGPSWDTWCTPDEVKPA
ncbi:uncharacterized protein LOC144440019 [Glandiceps talaboti]